MNEISGKQIVRKNIGLVIAGQLVSLFGTHIYSFAVGLYILKLTGSAMNFALTVILTTLPRIIFGPLAGVAADRFDRKKMIVLMDLLSGLVVLALLTLSYFDELRLAYIYIASVLLAVCNTFFTTPFMAATPNLVDDESVTRINSVSQSISALSSIAGPFLGGLVFAYINIELFLLVNGLSFIFSGVSEMFIDFKAREKIYGTVSNLQKLETEEEVRSVFSDMLDGIKYMKSQRWLVAISFIAIICNFFLTMGITIPIPYITRVIWGFTDGQFGILSSAIPFGMLAASIVISFCPEPESNYRRIIIGISVFTAILLLTGVLLSERLAVLENYSYLIILLILNIALAAAIIMINIPITVAMQTKVPNHMLGRVNGVLSTLVVSSVPAGAALGGILVDSIPAFILPSICGVFLLILVIYLGSARDLRSI